MEAIKENHQAQSKDQATHFALLDRKFNLLEAKEDQEEGEVVNGGWGNQGGIWKIEKEGKVILEYIKKKHQKELHKLLYKKLFKISKEAKP